MTDNEKVMKLMAWFGATVNVSTQLKEMVLRVTDSLDMGVTTESLPNLDDEVMEFIKSHFVPDEGIWAQLVLLSNKVG